MQDAIDPEKSPIFFSGNEFSDPYLAGSMFIY